MTALFRHPLGLPIPHTAIIVERRAKIIESIVQVVENDWLSPGVIGARLAKVAPSTLIVDWLSTPGHVARLGAPLRDLLRGLARMLTAEETARFVESALERQLREVPIDASAGRWLAAAIESDSAGTTFEAFAARSRTRVMTDHTRGPLVARPVGRDLRAAASASCRSSFVATVQRAVKEPCDPRRGRAPAAQDKTHPLRRASLDALGRWVARLAAGDPAAHEQAERVRRALLESLETKPLVRETLLRVRRELETELVHPASDLAVLIDRTLHEGIVEWLTGPERRDSFDRWVRDMADDLLRRHHHQIGLTVRENLEALDPGRLVEMIESRVGNDLQFIRLNGAIVGGLVGVMLATIHWLVG